jgi:homocysteine S-methyltransferase
LLKAVETLNVPIFAGFYANSELQKCPVINNEVPEIDIDIETIEKFRDRSREEQKS